MGQAGNNNCDCNLSMCMATSRLQKLEFCDKQNGCNLHKNKQTTTRYIKKTYLLQIASTKSESL